MELHDATLLSIEVDWPSRSAQLRVRTSAGDAEILAAGVLLIHAPRAEPWGPSSSVMRVVGPEATDSGSARLVIEMQSGDQITVEAVEFTGTTQ